MPGARAARWLMIAIAVLVIFGLVVSLVAAPVTL